LNGTYTDTTGNGVIKIVFGIYQNHYTPYYSLNCEFQMPLDTLPLCVDSAAVYCNYDIKLVKEYCKGFDAYGNPVYAIDISITNPNAYNENFTVGTIFGLLTSTPSVLAPGSNTINIQFTDTINYDAYICLDFIIDDTVVGICHQTFCFQITPCKPKCNMDACIHRILCAGFDSLGRQQYTVVMYYYNPFGYTANLMVSFLALQGLVSNVTPPNPANAYGLNKASFTFTDLTNIGILCMAVALTDTVKHITCMTNLSKMPDCLCDSLPFCDDTGFKISHSTSTPAITTESALLKAVPNPNTGNAIVYYKIPAKELCNNCRIVITETGSGKTICEKKLDTPAGFISIFDCKLANGDYMVTLWSDNKLVSKTQMQVVK